MASHDLATITNPSAALTDFTLIVDFSRMSASWWSANDTADGTKGRVFKADGTTELAADWIDFDNVAETGLLRVKWSGTLATTGTQQVWIEPPLAANASYAANATYGSDNAYDASWEGYYPTGGGTDRTVNGRDMTGFGSVSVGGVAGPLDKATDYDGSSQYSQVDVAAFAAVPGMIFAWMNPDNDFAEGSLVSVVDTSAGDQYMEMLRDWSSGNANTLVAISRNSTVYGGQTTAAWLAADGWGQAIVAFASSTSRTAYLNGGNSGSNASSSTPTGIDRTGIGRRVDSTPSAYFNGQIAEVHLHSAIRSAGWIASEYAQTNDNATFWGTWSWVAAGGAGKPAIYFQQMAHAAGM